MIDSKYIDMILARVDIEDIVSPYVQDLKRKGHRLWACCPFHTEKTASFCIDLATNKWHCFGSCNEGGNVISFVMKAESLPFPLAVKKILKDNLHIEIDDKDMQSSAADIELQKKKEAMYIINEYAAKHFIANIKKDDPKCKIASDYAKMRWGTQTINEWGIGYAINGFDDLKLFAKNNSLNEELLLELGLLAKNDKGNIYDAYRNRVMIPIRDNNSRIIGFTARTMDDHEDRKYINSRSSDIYSKDRSLFGIDNAIKKARQEEKFILVEGGPDVVKLQSVGVKNTVASLGGAWTENQFKLLHRYCTSVCFIPDSDIIKSGQKMGAGDLNVLKNGKLAMTNGFTVSVKEIPNEGAKKQDPDSYVTDLSKFVGMAEEEFLIWYARKTYDENAITDERISTISSICDLLALITDEAIQESYLNKLIATYHHKPEWTNGLKLAKKRILEKKSKENKKGSIDMLQEFGFIERHNCYYGTTNEGKEYQWSNFVMKPLFLIKDEINPVRLYEINNDDSEDRKEIIELNMDQLNSSSSFRKRLGGLGNYLWKVKDEQLIQLQTYLYKVTETADPIKQLGYQARGGFYCFCNGALEEGTWYDVDEMGIVRLKAGKYYLPAMSKIYADSTELYVNERKFRHLKYSNIPASEYFSRIVDVFGNNAKVGICFYLATLFRDIVKEKARSFAILNIFGPKGSGKTELAETLESFFMVDNDPQNIETASLPALADAVASVSNALIHIDEYKNSIEIRKIEWLKDIWGGIGRSRMNMDKDKKREQARVSSGVILTGQEMPTADIALFSRLIYLTYDVQHHSSEEKKKFNELQHYRLMGATHITIEILKHRENFEATFGTAWKKATADLELALKGMDVMDRIETNWKVPLSAYIALQDVIDMPFKYNDILDVCINGIIRQNSMCNTTDEVAGFWNIISSAQQKGLLIKGQDYKIKNVNKIRTDKSDNIIDFEQTRTILMLRKNIVMTTYRQLGKQMDEKLLPTESLLHYLMIASEYYGHTKNPERFCKYNNYGVPDRQEVKNDVGQVTMKTIWYQDRPMCFDYEAISTKYGIILDSSTDEELSDNDTDVSKEIHKEENLFRDKENKSLPF